MGVGEYEFPNPHGGGVFCLQRRLIDAMREQLPGAVLAFFQLVSRDPVRGELARVSPRSLLTLERLPEDRVTIQPIHDWAAQFAWASPPPWFLQHALRVALDLQQEEAVGDQVAEWVNRPSISNPSLLQLWSLGMPADYVSHPVPAPAPLPHWDPLAETEADYRSFLQAWSCDLLVEPATLEAYIAGVHGRMQALELSEEEFGQNRLNHLKVCQAHVDARNGAYRPATWLALRVFSGLTYLQIAQHDLQERREAQGVWVPQVERQVAPRVPRAESADSIKKQVLRLARATGIALVPGRPRGYRQRDHGRPPTIRWLVPVKGRVGPRVPEGLPGSMRACLRPSDIPWSIPSRKRPSCCASTVAPPMPSFTAGPSGPYGSTGASWCPPRPSPSSC